MQYNQRSTETDVFFDLSPDLMIIFSFEGEIIRINAAWESTFGYTEQEIKESKTVCTIHPDDLSKATVLFNDILAGKTKAIDFVERKISKDGEEFYFAWNLVADHKQQIIYGIGRNVTEHVSMVEDLKLVEQRFNSLFQNSAFGIILIGIDGKIIEANAKIQDRLGYEEKELLGMDFRRLVVKDDQALSDESFERLISQTVSSVTSDMRLISKNGTIAWSRFACSLIQLVNAETAVMALVEDIDEEKISLRELDEVGKQFEAIFYSSPSGIIITKNEGEILQCNPAFAEMVGGEVTELIGGNVFQFTHEEDRPESVRLVEMLNKGEISEYDVEKRYVKQDGTIIWAKTWVSLMERNDHEVLRVAIVENIDRRKRAEQKLEEKNTELMEINQELEHFAYVASHDLQEPLRTVASFIQILQKKYSHLLDEDGKQFMGFVVEGAKRMQSLIRDLLEYSRINRLNTDYERVDLNDVFQTVNRALKEKIDSCDAVILAENLPVIQGNKIQLTQIFQNLIDNAIKFKGDRQPEIIISVEELPGKWEICVRDNGIGISQEYFQRIFIIFQRLHTHEEYSGTGIGLALCKKIVERHGGDIWLDSVPNEGTAFTFTIAKSLIRAVS